MGSLILKYPPNARTNLDAAWSKFMETTAQQHDDKIDALKDVLGGIIDSQAAQAKRNLMFTAIPLAIGSVSVLGLFVLGIVEFLSK